MMRRLVRSAIHNSPAMNTLMVGILIVGTLCLVSMNREEFPEFDLEIVLVSVPYPGASPDEIERGICQKVEEAVQSIDGIKKMTSVAQEGAGSVVLELRADVKDVQKVVNEVRSEVDRIPSFPDQAEDPDVQQITFRKPAINVAVVAPKSESKSTDELELRAIAEMVRDELLLLPNVSQIVVKGVRKYQIDIELDEETLRKHGLSLPMVADIVRQENIEIPAGRMKSQGQEVLLRAKNKRLIGQEIEKLPLVTDPNGVVLTVGDLGSVHDEFEDTTSYGEINGQPAINLEIQRTSAEDLLAIAEEVRQYCEEKELPGGYKLLPWADSSVDVKGRLDLLIENGRMGLILVFLVLACFLELRLAFWVAMGIPISMLGAGGILLGVGQTLNMLSMFAFLMALGIIVDDAIVVGENIYAHRQMGKSFLQAAVDGTVEVVPSVTASVVTTIIAFCPLLFVSGVMGKFIAVMPISVIAMLVISLFESTLILPCHLAHSNSLFFRMISFVFYVFKFVAIGFQRINKLTATLLSRFVDSVYLPILRWCIDNKFETCASAGAVLLLAIGMVRGGFAPFVIFPKLDSNQIVAKITFPDGTPARLTDKATKRLVAAMERINASEGSRSVSGSLTKIIHRGVGSIENQQGPQMSTMSGSHVGTVRVELVESSERSITSQEINAMWRRLTGEIPGVESLSFGTVAPGPAGTPIEFKLLADSTHVEELEAAVEECKQQLAAFPGVFDITDDSKPGKWEFQITVKERAKAMGIRPKDISDTIRASFYGAEVMRLQRGRHEVKLMVRYPPEQRSSMASLNEIRVRTQDGEERPLPELAEINVVRGYSEINRLDQRRSITISADVNEDTANARNIVKAMQGDFVKGLNASYPNVQVRWEGQQEQTRESMVSLIKASGIALIVMYALLTFQFKSYLQPVLILMIIPFGIVGAILGHVVHGIPLTLFSFFGLVALTGVVVNDSIVLIDFINARVRSGMSINEALLEAGRRRFRPVLLTSATTIAGLLPILLETSFQAQFLVPMAVSIAFGLLLATVLVLLLVPTFYRIYSDLLRVVHAPLRSDTENEQDVHNSDHHLGTSVIAESS